MQRELLYLNREGLGRVVEVKMLHNMWAQYLLSLSHLYQFWFYLPQQDRMWWEESYFLPQTFKLNEIDHFFFLFTFLFLFIYSIHY